MTETELMAQLLRWGMVQTVMLDKPELAPESPRDHRLQRLRRFAPGTRERAARKTVKRDGDARRRIMARAAGKPGPLPAWSCDPIPCNETRSKAPLHRPAPVMPIELQWIDPAIDRLSSVSPIRAAVVRAEFTYGATQKDRARYVAKTNNARLSFWQYRRELESAIAWLLGHRSALAA